MLRVATWNMDCWKAPRKPEGCRHADAWRYLIDDLAPDVALTQECVASPELGSVTYWPGGISASRPWGSAVWANGFDLQAIRELEAIWRGNSLGVSSPAQTLPGAVALARVDLGSFGGMTLISVYGVIERGYATTTMHRILSDLEPLFDDPRYGDDVILGGDFNVGTQWRGSDERFNPRDRSVLDRLAAFGLVDCVDARRDELAPEPACPCLDEKPCRHIRTQWNLRYPDTPYQNDYLFASEHLVRDRLARVEVHNALDHPAQAFSDHCPIVATFELGR